MNFRIEVICMREDGTEERREVMNVTKEQLALETRGLTLAEGKELLASVQTVVVEEQAATHLAQRRLCLTCRNPHRSKEPRHSTVNTVFAAVAIPNPRWHRCSCQTTGPLTFRPTAQWLTGHTSPELLYLETKWASLIPYADVPTLIDSVQVHERTRHSEKPEKFRDIINTLCPHGRRLELFARVPHDGWESYGNQLRAVSEK